MFSAQDIMVLARLAAGYRPPPGASKDYTLFVFMLVTQSGTYALKIEDPAKFFGAINGSFKTFSNYLKKEYYKKTPNDPQGGFEKVFLNLITHYDLGLALHKADAQLTQWSKLELDPINNTVKPKNCN